MSTTIHYTNCPVCGSDEIENIFSVKDYTVSNESFMIAECASCSLRFTQDAPGANTIASYYKSEDYISHTNTSKGFINRLYKFVRNRTMIKKRRLVEKTTSIKNGVLLDIGSGIGTFANEMKQHGWHTVGLEPDSNARLTAKNIYGMELMDTGEFENLSPNFFDAITLWHVLEHVHDLHRYLQKLKVLLKANGRILIAVPNYTSKDAIIYEKYWAAYDVPRHLYHFSPQSMQVLLKKNELRILKYKPMWYDSFYISLLSSKYKRGRSNVIAAFWNGLRSNLKAMEDEKECSSVIYIVTK